MATKKGDLVRFNIVLEADKDTDYTQDELEEGVKGMLGKSCIECEWVELVGNRFDDDDNMKEED